MTDPATVRVLVYPDVELLDVAGPVNVLTAASRLAGGVYDVALVSEEGGSVRTAGGVEVVTRPLVQLSDHFHTLLVPGGVFVPRGMGDLVGGLAARADRVVGVCSGALLLADAGLLVGRRAATHWVVCDELRRRAPGCDVEEDAIFVRDGRVWTSAGVTAGMDLALALVEQDHGPELALQVARWLVMYLRRHGGQSQFSAPLAAQQARTGPIRELVGWVRGHLDADLSVPALAKRAGMSPRNFARVFRAEVGETPASWVERARVEAARAALEGSDQPIKQVAARCGFASAATMSRAFRRQVGTSPQGYRARFRVS